MPKRTKLKKSLLLALKISLGSSLAIYTAEFLRLQYASAAGIVTLLTLVTTRKGTLRLSINRLITFALVGLVTSITFIPIQDDWIAYGLFVFLMVAICDPLGWQATISTNAVIGTHFLMTHDFSPQFFLNEFLLVTIGITFATLLNQFHDIQGQKKNFSQSIQMVEHQMQELLTAVADYLSEEESKDVWANAADLEETLQELMADAYEYEGNTYDKDASYFAKYFEMRLNQCHIVHNLHYEMKKIKDVPYQAKMVAEYIRYLSQYVTELNDPVPQLQYLNEIFQGMKKEPLPVSRGEFENRAVLYHILMDLEEFLICKKRFVHKEGAIPV